MAKKTAYCSFCGRTARDGARLIPSPIDDSHICVDCIASASEMLGFTDLSHESEQEATCRRARQASGTAGTRQTKKVPAAKEAPKPSEIKAFLDQYIVGQDMAKKYLSVAVYNHYKRLDQPDDAFTIVDATVLTQAGYVGEDIESLLTRLLQVADYDVARAERGIVFIDEIDKIARKGDNPSITRDVGGEGVQQGLLKLLEGSIVNVPPQGGRKHPEQAMIAVDTRNILFICGGAFDGIEQAIAHRLNKNFVGFSTDPAARRIERDSYMSFVAPQDLKTFGLIPEIIGRLPILAHLQPLDAEALRRILTEPKNAIVRQYIKLFAMDGVALSFDEEALDFIVVKAIEFKLGARGLRSIVETIMMNPMYELPATSTKEFRVTADFCREQLEAAHFDAKAI